MTPDTSIYIHIPFCKHRCAYCDFNTYANQEDSIPAYVNALINEINFIGTQTSQTNQTIKTIFFGGGTPSLLSGLQFDSILQALFSSFTFTPNPEISIEANPGTVSPQKLDTIRKAGVNRISFGVQSANMEELKMLEREHNFFDVIEAVSSARKAGFDNLNLDLIYGLPEQTLSTWQTTVKRILALHPEHISAYALTLEHGTPFGKWTEKGLLPLPNPDLAADMYEWTCEYLFLSGYAQYEISNWGLDRRPMAEDRSLPSAVFRPPSFACQHNLQYWKSLPYLGLGAGAHGYVNGIRYSNVLRIKTYIERLENQLLITNYQFPITPATVNQHKQTLTENMSDYMLNNFRLTNAGVAESDFRLRFGSGLMDVYPNQIATLMQSGLIEHTSENYRLTKRGRLLGNQVFLQFV